MKTLSVKTSLIKGNRIPQQFIVPVFKLTYWVNIQASNSISLSLDSTFGGIILSSQKKNV